MEDEAPPGWVDGTFAITKLGGTTDKVTGFTRGPFGIDRRDYPPIRTNPWILTHVPSGLSLGGFVSSKIATAGADLLEHMAGRAFFETPAWTKEQWGARPRGMTEALDELGRLTSPLAEVKVPLITLKSP